MSHNDDNSQKLTFDLNLLEIALQKAIELCDTESNILSYKMNIRIDELNRISEEKENIMNFVDWHIPIIVRYIKMHKNTRQDISDLKTLAIRAKTFSDIEKINDKLSKKNRQTIGNDKVSTITFMQNDSEIKPFIDIVFLNDSHEMPSKIYSLLKQMMSSLENNFHKISIRKQLNDQILNIAYEVMKSDSLTYNPKKKKISKQSNLILNEDC